MNDQPTKLMEALEELETDIKGSQITVEDVVQTLNHRGFGTLLLVPSALTILPTGMVPGVPLVCAVIIMAITAQMVMGREYPWMPRRLKAISFRKKHFQDRIESVQPVIEAIDKMTHPRMSIMNYKWIQMLVALISLFLAVIIGLIGFIPFVPAILATPIFFFALGLSARDGLFTSLGFALTIGAVATFPRLLEAVASGNHQRFELLPLLQVG